jgi:hypothetical protein
MDTKGQIQNAVDGLPKDRRLRTDGFIIRAQSTIRTDGFSSVQGFGNSCALRAPTPSKFFGCTPSEKFERGFSGKPDAEAKWRTISQCQKRFTPRSSIVRGWFHHPCASDDPRGRFPSAQVWRRLARSVQSLARCARQPRPNCSDTHHPKNLNAVFRVNRMQGREKVGIEMRTREARP